jgi:F-type H+-transporting ATPase subunit gamma
MNTLREIRRRINSIKNIEQITKSMEMVAAARLHKAQIKAEHSKRYATKIKQIMENLIASSHTFTLPLFVQKEIKKTGIVLFGADRGLSGPYNSNLYFSLDRFLKNYTPENVELILFGKKAIDYYQRRKWPIASKRTDWGGKITLQEVKDFTNQLLNLFLSGEYSEIWFVYTHYITVFSMKVIVEKFLNIERPKHQNESITRDWIYEPNLEELIADILPRYCLAKIQNVLNEAYVSELAARVSAMRMATKNAEELLETLTLTRNKVRQGSITKEILEITTGAEGIKSI